MVPSRLIHSPYLLAATLLVFCTGPARAGNWLSEIRIGMLDHATELTSSGREDGIDISLEAVFGETPLWGSPRVFLGVAVNSGDDTDQFYSGIAWRWRREDLFLRLGFGAAVHNGDLLTIASDKRSLGTRGLFHSSIEAGWQITPRYDLSFYYQHVSNGPIPGRGGANQGLDNAGLRLGISF